MINMNNLRKNFLLIGGLIGGGGIITLIGLSLPYISISYSQANKIVLDGFKLYYLESIPQVLGCFLSLTSVIIFLIHCRNLKTKNLEKKVENIVLLLVLSVISSFFGLFLTVIDIIDSNVKASALNIKNPVLIQIGFIFSLIGPFITLIGLYFILMKMKV